MKQSELFRTRADKIDRLQDDEFGGAVCIVPPNGEDIIDWDSSEKNADPIRFWLRLKTDVEAKIQMLDERARNQQAFRVR